MSVVAFSRVSFPDRSLGEAFAAALADRSHLVDGFPGFQRLEVMLPARHDGDWMLATWWDTRADLRRWLRSDEHERTHGRAPAELQPYLRSARVEIFEVQA